MTLHANAGFPLDEIFLAIFNFHVLLKGVAVKLFMQEMQMPY